jgi:formyltetrahydrofolate synthetase
VYGADGIEILPEAQQKIDLYTKQVWNCRYAKTEAKIESLTAPLR